MRSWSASDLLAAVEELDAFGGASLGLIAWEFGVMPRELAELWDSLIETALLERSRTETVLGEELYRVTAAGHILLAGTPPIPL